MNASERKVLNLLAEDSDGYYVCFAYITSNTDLDRKQVRRACRSLARKGLTKYARGLWSEDGEPCGSGYGITDAGRAAHEAGTGKRRT